MAEASAAAREDRAPLYTVLQLFILRMNSPFWKSNAESRGYTTMNPQWFNHIIE